jgi:hypothetical protein
MLSWARRSQPTVVARKIALLNAAAVLVVGAAFVTEKSTVTETSVGSRSPRLPQLLGRLGLYATYVAAALILLVVAGDLDVLVGGARLVGQLALLVAGGPLAAMLLGTFASYVNYYGVWRVLRGKDEYDAGQDLKSHAADVPQALETVLAGRAGCLPAASAVLLFVSLLLAVATIVPPATPVIGELATWNERPGARTSQVTIATPTATAAPTATATALPTATPQPTAIPTATPIPGPIIRFSVSPTTASWPHCADLPPPKTLTLDNSRSTVAVHWNASAIGTLITGGLWATITPASGTIAASGTQSITVNPDQSLCSSSSPNGTAWQVKIVTANAGNYTFIYTVS